MPALASSPLFAPSFLPSLLVCLIAFSIVPVVITGIYAIDSVVGRKLAERHARVWDPENTAEVIKSNSNTDVFVFTRAIILRVEVYVDTPSLARRLSALDNKLHAPCHIGVCQKASPLGPSPLRLMYTVPQPAPVPVSVGVALSTPLRQPVLLPILCPILITPISGKNSVALILSRPLRGAPTTTTRTLTRKCSGDDEGNISLSFSFDAIRRVWTTASVTSSVSAAAAAAQVELDVGASPTCPALVQSQPAGRPAHTLRRAAALKRTTHVPKRSSKGTTYARKDSADKENCSSGSDAGAHGNIQTPRRTRLVRFQLHR
ncbi:hypothetical protein DFH08DRAFT_798944 [Mycena albidolilacea]|uniref:Uncharacterized protein n=1 Tax=Mycena albidolilacea TaxID=1033008 RepID=A0AAD7APQ8_9AGAR|nr:hypothetical protein DFH08DRAFT_798944 [Mycena albidolilacea]